MKAEKDESSQLSSCSPTHRHCPNTSEDSSVPIQPHHQKDEWNADSDMRVEYLKSPSREISKSPTPDIGQGGRDSPGTWTSLSYDKDMTWATEEELNLPFSKKSLSSFRSLSEERTFSDDPSDNTPIFVRARSAEIFSANTDWEMSENKSFDTHTAYESLNSLQNSNSTSYTCASSSKHSPSLYSSSFKDNVPQYFSSENLTCDNSLDAYESSEDFKREKTNSNSNTVESKSNSEKNSNLYSKYRSSNIVDVDKTNAVTLDDSQYSKDYDNINENPTVNYQTESDKINKRLSSYKQLSNDELEEMEDDDNPPIPLPDVYQSYEEDIVAPHVQNANMMAALSMQNAPHSETNDEPKPWGSGVDMKVPSSPVDQLCLSSSSDIVTSTKTTVTEAASPDKNNTSNTSSATLSKSTPQSKSPSSSQTTFTGSNSQDNDCAFRTGDQSFKTTAARQSAINSFIQGAKSSGNPSSFTGPSVIQGK